MLVDGSPLVKVIGLIITVRQSPYAGLRQLPIMTTYSHTVGGHTYQFGNLRELMAKASPARSGDYLAGIAAADDRSEWRRR